MRDGIGDAAAFAQPIDVALTADGSTLYVVDSGAHNVRRVSGKFSGCDSLWLLFFF